MSDEKNNPNTAADRDAEINMLAHLKDCPRYDHKRRICLYDEGRPCVCRDEMEGTLRERIQNA